MNLVKVSTTALLLLTLAACGGGGSSSGGSSVLPPPPPPPPPTNNAPTFTSATDFTFNENESVSFVITVNDADGDTITITDDNRGDGALFTVDVATGQVTANTNGGSFDFENPQDIDGNNVYEQSITLSDGTDSVTEVITVTILGVDEPPICTAESGVDSFDENFVGDIFTFTGSDPEGESGSFSPIVTRNSAGFSDFYSQFSFDEATGVISVTQAFDFEAAPENLTFTFDTAYNVGSFSDLCSVTLGLDDIVGVVTSGIRIDNQPRSSGGVQLSAPLLDVDGRGQDDHFIEKTITGDRDVLQPGGYVLYGEALSGLLSASDAATLDVSNLTADQGVFISKPISTVGKTLFEGESITATSLSDIDGDGLGELLIGVSMINPNNTDDNIIGYVVYGSVFAGQTISELNLNNLTDAQGMTITLPTSPNVSNDFETGFISGDVDGDGLLDAIITTLDVDRNGHTYVVRGSGLQTQRGITSTFSLSGQTTDLVVEMFEGESDNFVSLGHRYATIIEDIRGDGIDEIIVSTSDGLIVLTSEAVTDVIANGRQTYLSLINSDLARTTSLDFNINEPLFARKKVDVDNDGRSDLIYAHDQAFGEIGGVVYGAHLQNLFPGNGSSLPKTVLQEAVEEFIGFPFVGTAILGDITGDGQNELAFADASRVHILTENVINPMNNNFNLANLMAGDGVVLTGISDVSGLGRGLSSLSDVSGDGLPELVILDPRSPGYYSYIVRSETISEALSNGITEITLESLFADETTP